MVVHPKVLQLSATSMALVFFTEGWGGGGHVFFPLRHEAAVVGEVWKMVGMFELKYTDRLRLKSKTGMNDILNMSFFVPQIYLNFQFSSFAGKTKKPLLSFCSVVSGKPTAQSAIRCSDKKQRVLVWSWNLVLHMSNEKNWLFRVYRGLYCPVTRVLQ